MKIRSFAKINLGLEVEGKRPDNYHNIRTLFQAIDVSDILEFIPLSSSSIDLQGDDESIFWGEDNLVFRAARQLQEKFRITEGVGIRVSKNIPAGRGLGGGSSNAAMTLYALNKMWALGLSKEVLIEEGRTLGADIPFFFEGGLCLGLERGDHILPLPDISPLFCVLVIPPFPVGTAGIYSSLLPSFLTSNSKDSKINRFLTTRELGFLENRLEETVFNIYPQLKDIKSLFQSQGAVLSLVTGTGSAVFGIFEERGKAEKSLERMSEQNAAVLAETLPRTTYWKRIDAGV
ncbi:MAG: 4-(cytidine 5'-diphospho)-2-C-methyl-D-erythritol kinase [Candidatus Aminicenantales bacterium]